MKLKKGFTLFELLVSISIIGILTALAVVSFSNAQKKARDTRRVEDMKNIQTAAEQYYSQIGTYTYPSTTNVSTDWAVNSQSALQAFPMDPKGTGWTSYIYSGGSTYCACAAVENRASGNSTDNICSVGTGVTGPYFCVKNQQ